MYDHLPPIHINVTGSLLPFLKRIADIGNQSGLFVVETRLDVLGNEGFHILNLRFKNSTPHIDLGGQLIIQPEVKCIVAVEVRARRWSPDEPPSYETYCNAARSIFRPLLSTYNREANTRLRLSIPAKAKLEPKLPPKTEKLFQRFIALANRSCLHPLDWRRFYDFVRGSRNRIQLPDEDIARLLMKEGFSEEYSRHIGEIFGHLCEFKRLI